MKERRDDPLLRALAEIAREEGRDALADPRWEALAAGRATAADRAALERRAAESPEAAGAPQLFAPRGAAAEDRFTAAILAEIQRSRGPAAAAPQPLSSARSAQPITPPPRPRARRWPLAAGGALAMAAAIALYLFQPWNPGERALPAFDIAISVVAQGRVEPVNAAVPSLSPGATMVLSLRPVKRVRPLLDARVFLVRGSDAAALPTEITRSASDLEVRAKLPTGSLARPGDAEIVVVVGGPRALPPDNLTRADEIPDRDGPRRRVIRRPIRFER